MCRRTLTKRQLRSRGRTENFSSSASEDSSDNDSDWSATASSTDEPLAFHATLDNSLDEADVMMEGGLSFEPDLDFPIPNMYSEENELDLLMSMTDNAALLRSASMHHDEFHSGSTCSSESEEEGDPGQALATISEQDGTEVHYTSEARDSGSDYFDAEQPSDEEPQDLAGSFPRRSSVV